MRRLAVRVPHLSTPRRLIPHLVQASPGFRRALTFTVEAWLTQEGEVDAGAVLRELAGYAGDLLHDRNLEEARRVCQAIEPLLGERDEKMALLVGASFLDPLLARVPAFVPAETLRPLLGPGALAYAKLKGAL